MSIQTDKSLQDISPDESKSKGAGGALSPADAVRDPGAYIARSYQREATRKRKSKGPAYKVDQQDEPEDREGMVVQHPDMLKQEPRDYLLIGRVVKRNCRPLTIAEAKHLKRNDVLLKLESEIRDL